MTKSIYFPNKIRLEVNTTGIMNTISFERTILSDMLGLTGFNSSGLSESTSAIMNTAYNLSYDTYIIMILDNLPCNSVNGSTNQPALSFKIPFCNAVYSTLFQYNDRNSLEQSIEINDPNFILNKLKISFYDRYGYKILNSLDYSTTLEISTF